MAIDDFGTGYSSLSYLRRAAGRRAQGRQVLHRPAPAAARDDALVSAILAMGQGMRLTSVAEGVEDAAQAEWLRGANCTLGQGFLWSRPVDLETARLLLTEPWHRPGGSYSVG